MDWQLEEQLVNEMGYSRSEVDRMAERTHHSRSFIDNLNMNRLADGEIPSHLEYEAERYHRQRRDEIDAERRAEEQREEERAFAEQEAHERARYEESIYAHDEGGRW